MFSKSVYQFITSSIFTQPHIKFWKSPFKIKRSISVPSDKFFDNFFNRSRRLTLKYCNVFLLLKTPFGLLTGLFNNLQVVTTINYYNVSSLHTLQTLLTIIYSLCPQWSSRINHAGVTQASVNYTLPISLYYSTHKVLKTHNKSSFSAFSVIAHYHIKSSYPAFGSSFRVHNSLLVTTSHTLFGGSWSQTNFTYYSAGFLYRCLLPVSTAVSRVTSQWEELPRHRGEGGRSVDWPLTVAAAALVTSPLVGEGVPCIAQIRHNIFQFICYPFDTMWSSYSYRREVSKEYMELYIHFAMHHRYNFTLPSLSNVTWQWMCDYLVFVNIVTRVRRYSRYLSHLAALWASFPVVAH
jgi:hypothetical protein